MKVMVFLALVLSVANRANAGYANIGTPNAFLSSEYGVQFFRTSGTRVGVPACVTPGQESRFVIDARTDAGKAMLSVLLTAVARGKRVTITGTGTCGIWGDTESVSFIEVED